MEKTSVLYDSFTFQYALILLILLLCQIAFVVMVWVYQTQLIQEMDEGFDTIWKNHIKEPVPMDSFQTIVSIIL